MATRSKIGVLKENGKVDAIYCHWDGYPSYNGATLVNHYDQISQVRKLISLGDISSLGATLDETNSYYGWREEEVPKRTYESVEAYENAYGDTWDEYIYLFKENKWYVYYENLDGEKIWHKVEDVLEEEQN